MTSGPGPGDRSESDTPSRAGAESRAGLSGTGPAALRWRAIGRPHRRGNAKRGHAKITPWPSHDPSGRLPESRLSHRTTHPLAGGGMRRAAEYAPASQRPAEGRVHPHRRKGGLGIAAQPNPPPPLPLP